MLLLPLKFENKPNMSILYFCTVNKMNQTKLFLWQSKLKTDMKNLYQKCTSLSLNDSGQGLHELQTFQTLNKNAYHFC